MSDGILDGEGFTTLKLLSITTTLKDEMIPRWDLAKLNLLSFTGLDNSDEINLLWDGFPNEDLTDAGNTTAVWNGTEYILPEASGGAWSSATEVMGGTFENHISVDTDSSDQVWITSDDNSDQEIYLSVRSAANAQVTASIAITNGGATNYTGVVMAIDSSDNGWFIYRASGTNDLTLSVTNSAGAVQHSLDEVAVDATNFNDALNTAQVRDVLYDGDAHVWIVGTGDAVTNLSLKGYNTTDGSQFQAPKRILVSGSTIAFVYVASDKPNKVFYIMVDRGDTTFELMKFNSTGNKIGSYIFSDTSGFMVGFAVSNDGSRLCLAVTDNLVASTIEFMVFDTTTMRLISTKSASINESSVQQRNKRSMTAGPDDRFHFVIRDDTGDLMVFIINKDGSVLSSIDNIDTAALTPAIVWNDNSTSNFMWLAYENTADNDIDTRTYDFLFDTNASGFTVQSDAKTMDNTITFGITASLETLPSNTSIDYDVSVDNGSNFDTTIILNETNDFSNTGTQVIIKTTLKSTDDFSTPKLKAWAFRGNRII